MTAVEWFYQRILAKDIESVFEQAKEMEKEQELKIKIQCFKESLQFIDDNYMAELLNIRIYNMEKELETFKSE
jgi:predicted HTH domain antitoxin